MSTHQEYAYQTISDQTTKVTCYGYLKLFILLYL